MFFNFQKEVKNLSVRNTSQLIFASVFFCVCRSVGVCVCVCVCVCDMLFMGMAAGVMCMMLWNDFPPIMCMYISCVYMYSWIRCRVDLYVFFSDVSTYCVMLQAFICYCSYVRCLWYVCVCECVYVWVCVCECVCVFFCCCCYCSLALFSAVEHV